MKRKQTRLQGFGSMEIVKDRYSYRYPVQHTAMNTDPYVRKALRTWNRDRFEACDGFTKRPHLDQALQQLKAFGHKYKSRPDFEGDEFMSVCFRQAIDETRRRFIPDEPLIRIATADSAVALSNDSSAGFHFPNRQKQEVCEEAFDLASLLQHRVRKGMSTYVPPCKLAMRGHLRELDSNKTRVVWSYPYEVSILEGKWGVPYIDWLQSRDHVLFGERSMLRLAERLSTLKANESEVTLDWSRFDSSIPPWLTDIAFDILWDSFDNAYVRMEETDTIVYQGEKGIVNSYRVFQFLRTYFTRTKIMLPDGRILRKNHGVPSGSVFTQVVGSIVNYFVVSFLMKYFKLDGYGLTVLGDDSTFKVPSIRLTVERRRGLEQRVSQTAKRLFGMTLKVEKVRFADSDTDRSFLGYRMHGFRYIRETSDWFKMALYAEHDVDDLRKSASRMVAFYILGGCHDLEFCSFFREFFRVYPQLRGRQWIETRSIRKLLKYVLRIDRGRFSSIQASKINVLGCAYCLSLGEKPFDE